MKPTFDPRSLTITKPADKSFQSPTPTAAATYSWQIFGIAPFKPYGPVSFNYPFRGNQTMQMYGSFEGFPLTSALFGLVNIMSLYRSP